MTDKNVRVRFAPSPTGGLHMGGVRTVLYNYLFARHNGGKFILRIEDTDQSRFVPGAEEYIFDCLGWCGLIPDESTRHGGDYGPYRQSERKYLYRRYAEELIKKGYAYYAFDTSEELEEMRINLKTSENPSPQYDSSVRSIMKNSLAMSELEVNEHLQKDTPYVIRIKMPEQEEISFEDVVHGRVTFDSSLIDDKVLLKADGMPTYHLAVVVDDYLMKITHAFRGEEWLSSAPVHIMLWKYLFGIENMPKWAHFPLIMGPSGKLSKRDGTKYGFPVFAMNWNDPGTNELTEGFKEKGFLPEAFINLLAVLGWNDGTEQELFTLEELIESFTLDRVHKAGAKFDYDKARWFNHEWIKKTNVDEYAEQVRNHFERKGIQINDEVYFKDVLELVKDRSTLLPDFFEQASYFFTAPVTLDTAAIQAKWTESKSDFFNEYCSILNGIDDWQVSSLETSFKDLAAAKNIKPGELQLPMRIMLVGGKFGPAVFEIASRIGKGETISRIKNAMTILK